MVTAEEGGPTATKNTSSSYGGGGAGGKFRKKTSRRQPTPYDRPPIATPTTNGNASSWLTKLVVDPTSKLIAYGAERFLPSIFRKSLPLPPRPPPPQTPDVNGDVTDEVQEEILNQDSTQQPADDESSQPVNSSRSNSVSEIEQLFKRKIFSRPEIVHLTELLRSRVAEESLGNDSQKDEEDETSDLGRQEQFASGLLEENRNEEMVPSAVISTPLPNSRVLEDAMASPAELAKAYMGSRPSKVSSASALRARHQVGMEDPGLLGNRQFASKSPIMSLISKTPLGQAASEIDFRTPRSRGRSAIYNMARTPFSRVRPTSVLKGSRIDNDNVGPSMTSTSLSLMDNGEKFPSHALTLKRRSSDMDDGHGSVGPIRRLRQKSNLLAPQIHHTSRGLGSGSHANQKLQLIGKPGHEVSVRGTDNESVPRSNYPSVPSKSSEVAARILQHLENLTPKEKSMESKLTPAREKSPLKSALGMPSAQALRNTEDVAPLKLLDGHESGDMPNVTLPNAPNSSPQKPSMVAKNGKNLRSDTLNPVTKNDHVVPFRSSRSSINTTDPVVENGASIPPQKRRAFKMCAQEDTLELDDDLHHNGIQSAMFSEKTQTTEASLMDTRKIEPSTPSISSVISFPASEVTSKATESALIPPSAAKFDKPKEASSPLLADRFPALPVVFGKSAESNVESSKSLANISAPAASQVKIPEFGNDSHSNHMAGPDTAKGPFFSSLPSVVINTAYDKSLAPTGGAFQLTSSASVSNTPAGTIANTSSNTSGSIFGLVAKPLDSVGGLFCKFGSSVDPATAVSTESTSTTSEIALQRTDELNPKSGSTSSTTSNNLQGSFTGNGTKSLVSDSGSSLAGTSVSSVAPASSLSFGINSTTSGSSFGFGPSSSSLGGTTVLPVSEPTSVSFKFGASPAASEANASGATPGVLGFGFSSSSASTNTVGPSSGATPSKFTFGGTSTVTTSETSATAFGLNSSTSSSTVNPVSSNSAPNPTSQSPKPSAFGQSTAFSFGAPPSSSAPAISPLTSAGFSFGAPPSSSAPAISPSTSAGFSFGTPFSSSAPAISPSPSAELSFGAPSSSSAPAVSPSPSTGFSFGASSAPATSFGLASSSTGATATGFSFGASSSSALVVSPSPSTGFSFGASSSPATSFGLLSSSAGAPATGFSFGASSSSAPAIPPSTSTGFSFGASSAPATSFGSSSSSAGASATGFSFGAPSALSGPASASSPTGFSFGATSAPATSGFSFGASTPSTATNASSVMFNSSAGASPNPFFSSTEPSTPLFPSSPLPSSQPVFGSGFTASPGNNDPMMAEDQAPSTATFGQPSPSPPGFAFGSTTPSQPNPFMFAGQQNQAAATAAPNPSPFQASGQFNAGGSFSLGSGGGGGGDKSGRKIVKASRTKNRKR